MNLRNSLTSFVVTVALSSVAIGTGAGCSKESPQHVRNAGSLALSNDDALVYAADADNGIVAVVDAESEAKVTEVPVGAHPEAILVGPDDRVWVANRGSGTLSHFRRGEWHEVDTIPVGVEPVSLAMSKDGKTLYVVNAAALEDALHGSLMAIDTATLKPLWDLQLPLDPRSVALLSEKRAVVSLYRSGDVVEVDLEERRIVRGGTGLFEAVNRNPFETSGGDVRPNVLFLGGTVRARGMSQVVASPDGKRVYATTTLSSDAVLNDPNRGGGGGSYGSGSGSDSTGCGAGGAVTTSGLVAFDPEEELAPRVDSVQDCGPREPRDHPPTLLTSFDAQRRVQGPTAALVDATGTWLFIAHRETNNVAVVPTARNKAESGSGTFSPEDLMMRSDPMKAVVTVGSAPTGLALTKDGTTLWVHNQFDHTVQRLESGNRGALTASTPVRFAEDNLSELTPEALRGRRLFFSATDTQMNGVGISCASCHLEGREDGHVWNFIEGPRQTPSLAGRRLAETGPFHWGGEHSDFKSFVDHTVGERMGGSGLSEAQQSDLMAFIMSMPSAPNPHQKSAPTDAQIRGAQAFQKAECDDCHAQATAFQNTERHDVGTYVIDGPVPDSLEFFAKTGGLNTPSLLGLARTAPYLHDGSAATLKDRLLRDKDGDRHGKTSQLTMAEVDDLVEYLKSL